MNKNGHQWGKNRNSALVRVRSVSASHGLAAVCPLVVPFFWIALRLLHLLHLLILLHTLHTLHILHILHLLHVLRILHLLHVLRLLGAMSA